MVPCKKTMNCCLTDTVQAMHMHMHHATCKKTRCRGVPYRTEAKLPTEFALNVDTKRSFAKQCSLQAEVIVVVCLPQLTEVSFIR